jgi:hypothetical protein
METNLSKLIERVFRGHYPSEAGTIGGVRGTRGGLVSDRVADIGSAIVNVGVSVKEILASTQSQWPLLLRCPIGMLGISNGICSQTIVWKAHLLIHDQVSYCVYCVIYYCYVLLYLLYCYLLSILSHCLTSSSPRTSPPPSQWMPPAFYVNWVFWVLGVTMLLLLSVLYIAKVLCPYSILSNSILLYSLVLYSSVLYSINYIQPHTPQPYYNLTTTLYPIILFKTIIAQIIAHSVLYTLHNRILYIRTLYTYTLGGAVACSGTGRDPPPLPLRPVLLPPALDHVSRYRRSRGGG